VTEMAQEKWNNLFIHSRDGTEGENIKSLEGEVVLERGKAQGDDETKRGRKPSQSRRDTVQKRIQLEAEET